MPVNTENTVSTSEPYDAEEMSANNNRIFSKLFEERIRANLNP